MWKQRVATAVGAGALVAAIVAGSAAADPPQAVLKGRAVLPAATFAPGPPSGGLLGGLPINGVSVPFASQPVQGFSAILPAEPGSYWVMPDNGYGAKANSADFLLRRVPRHPGLQARQERAERAPSPSARSSS